MTSRMCRARLVSCLLGISVVACSGAVGTAPTISAAGDTPEPTTVAAGTPEQPPEIPLFQTATQMAGQEETAFTVAVIVDTLSEPVTREQATAVVADASSFLRPLAGISLLMTDFVEDGEGGTTSDLASRYITSHAEALPNGLVIFSYGDDGRARSEGGYGFAVAGPAGFANAFRSPVMGNGQIYTAVVHFSHRYQPCGYGGSDTVQSTRSLPGECGNQAGAACIEHNGYSMCADALPHLYASRPTYLVSSTIVHELVHTFAAGGEEDHYNTPECNQRMGYPEQFYDLQEGQYHNGLCPFVYTEFAGSYVN